MELNREQQIEKMAKEICAKCKSDTECEKILCTMAYREAEYLVSIGYRKATEVAREIFEEIERLFDKQFASAKARHRTKNVYAWCETDGEITGITEARMLIAELKKKYTEAEGDS